MGAHPLKILIIDDDEDTLLIIQGLLSQVKDASYELEWVDNDEKGLTTLLHGRHCACLLDYRLGAHDGLDVLRRAIAAGCHVPIIMMTGHATREVDLQAMQAGAADFLAKEGLTPSLLERVLRYTIERRRAEEQHQRDEALCRLLTAQLPAIMWTTDDQLRFTSSHGAGLRGLTLQPNQVVGRTVCDYFQTRDAHHPSIAAHLKALEGESVSFELEWMGKLFEARVEPICQGPGQVKGTIGVALDITERRQVELGFQAARQIQQRLLPQSAPVLAGFDIAGICRPADATGGDFFDYVPRGDGSLGIVVADVSSHGFAPALIMAQTRRVLRTLAAGSHDLATVMSATNQAIVEDTSDLFVTAFFAQVNLQSRILTYVGAGHEGYLLGPTGKPKKLASTAPPLGVIDGIDFPCEGPVQFQAGQLLVLLTDGFAEATAPDGRLFGIRRTLSIIRAYRARPAAEILEKLHQAIRDFCHPAHPHDDITGVIVKVEA